jgi:hypothetical protein
MALELGFLGPRAKPAAQLLLAVVGIAAIVWQIIGWVQTTARAASEEAVAPLHEMRRDFKHIAEKVDQISIDVAVLKERSER